jgi:hypothetical protein
MDDSIGYRGGEKMERLARTGGLGQGMGGGGMGGESRTIGKQQSDEECLT